MDLLKEILRKDQFTEMVLYLGTQQILKEWRKETMITILL